MYCTELVAKCINYGLEKEIVKPTVKLNNKFYYGLDDIYKNEIRLDSAIEKLKNGKSFEKQLIED